MPCFFCFFCIGSSQNPGSEWKTKYSFLWREAVFKSSLWTSLFRTWPNAYRFADFFRHLFSGSALVQRYWRGKTFDNAIIAIPVLIGWAELTRWKIIGLSISIYCTYIRMWPYVYVYIQAMIDLILLLLNTRVPLGATYIKCHIQTQCSTWVVQSTAG